MKLFTTILPFLILLFTAKAGAQTALDVEQPTAVEHALSGWSTAVNGEHAIVASPQKDTDKFHSVGEITFYRYSDGEWNIGEIFQPSALPALSNFGHEVALYGETAAASSFADNNSSLFSGSVYMYEFAEDKWDHSMILKGSDTEIGHRFGYSIDLKGSMLVSGAYLGTGAENKTGAAYIFENVDNEWIESAKLIADDGKTSDYFGYSTHIINENSVAIGAYKADGANQNSGAVYIFSRTDEGWEQVAKLSDPNGSDNDLFGYSLSSLSITGAMESEHQMLIAGAPGATGEIGKTGAVFAYSHSGDKWNLASTIMKDDININSHFGISLASNHDNKFYIGASQIHSGSDRKTGSVYAYKVDISDNEALFIPEIEITAQQTENYEQFGVVISATSEFLLISSPYTNRGGNINAGSVHFYRDQTVSIEDDHTEVTEIAMKQNYPNPFNPSTVISYQLPVNSEVQLEVFDMIGRKVSTLVNGQIKAGRHQVTFDARNLASGMYIYRLQTEGKVITKKLTLIK